MTVKITADYGGHYTGNIVSSTYAAERDLIDRGKAAWIDSDNYDDAEFTIESSGAVTEMLTPVGSFALNQFERILQKNGVVANGTTDDASNLQAALIETRAGGYPLIFPPDIRAIKLNSGITLMADKDRFEALSTILLDFSGMTSGVAVNITSEVTDINYAPLVEMQNNMKGFRLLGGAAAGVTAFRFNGASTHTFFYQVRNCTADNFALTVDFYTNTFGIAFEDFTARGSTGATIIQCLDGGGSNYGERYNFTRCMLYNTARGLLNTNPNATFNFLNCSLDGLDVTADIRAGRVSLETCHVETNICPDYIFKLSGNEASTLKMSNIEMSLLSSTHGFEVFDIAPEVIFGGVFAEKINMSILNYTPPLLTRGGGRSILKDVTGFAVAVHPPMSKYMNQIRYGMDNAAALAEWTLSGAVPPAIDTVTKYSGAGSLYFAPSSALSQAEITLNIEPDEEPRFSFKYQREGAPTAGQAQFNSVIVWRDSKGTEISNNVVTTIDGNNTWLTTFSAMPYIKPPGTKSYTFRLIKSADAAVTGKIWIDELVINHI